MKIFPAIDMIDGNVVRLFQGDYSKVTKYNTSIEQVAENFALDGATCLHLVDLTGAKSGKADQAKYIENILKKFSFEVQVGGGIRTEDQIKRYLDAGAARVILGTIAIKDSNFVAKMVDRYAEHIAVGVDAKDGAVAIQGWQEVTKVNAVAFCKDMQKIGVTNIIYTDISRDGAMIGTNLEVYQALALLENINIIASGGITYLDELQKLKELNLYGAILGKALYEKRLNLSEALKVAKC